MLIWSLEQWGNCCATGLSKAITVKAKLETRIPECGLDYSTTATAAKLLQPCLTLCDAVDGSPSSSSIPGILQARTLEWVAISFSNAWKWKVRVKLLSHVQLSPTPWTAAHQAPLSMGFSRQEYWNGVLLPSPTREDTHHKRISSFYITLAQATWSLDWLDSIAQCATHCKGQE